jgi:hypothetical protein
MSGGDRDHGPRWKRPVSFYRPVRWLVGSVFVALTAAACYQLAFKRYIPCETCLGNWDREAYAQQNGIRLERAPKVCPACHDKKTMTYLEWYFR